jgi:hypothetical protein
MSEQSFNEVHTQREENTEVPFFARGWLKNGNPPGDFRSAARCHAHSKRTGQPCQQPAMKGKARCRLHGGKSTGPRTPEGLARSRKANWKHGERSAEAIKFQKGLREWLKRAKAFLRQDSLNPEGF